MVRKTKILLVGWLGLAVVMAGLFGCDDDLEGTETGSLQYSPDPVAFTLVPVGETEQEVLTLRNVADTQRLVIYDIELVEGDGGRIDELSLHGVPSLPMELEPNEDAEVVVEYSPEADMPPNRGQILVDSSDPSYGSEPASISVNTMGNWPEFRAEPPVVRFQRIQPGDISEQTVRVTNDGDGPLTIFEEPAYAGGADFDLEDTGRNYPLQLQPHHTRGADDPPEDYILEVDVTYRPLGDGADTGEIQFVTNDITDPSSGAEQETHKVDVRADAESPCIEVDSRTRDFGQVPVGEVARDTVSVTNCGSKTLELYQFVLEEEDDDGAFGLELGPWDQTGDEQLDDTVELEAGETDTFLIRFTPVEEATKRGTLTIINNDDFQSELELELVARGAEGTCPEAVATAVIRGTPAQPSSTITATPLDYVVLDGAESHDEDGEVVSWEWQILESPPGTPVELEPAQSDPQDQDPSVREVQVLTAGTYRFGLTVEDDSGFQSCQQAEVEVIVIPDQNIHIELTWTNPDDPDETDSQGSDVDVHLVKMGPGQWFESPYSIFYLNPNSEEDPIWDPEDPSLDIDVQDGMGPENITMSSPDHCQWYAVGVHYFAEMWGTAYATIRIYINGSLRYERPFYPLEQSGNFWDAARIHWDHETSDATILDVDGFYPVAPQGEEPVVTQDMINSGRCTAEGLY